MIDKSFLTLILILSCGASLFAQEKYNLSRFVDEWKMFVRQPAKWEGPDYLKLGAVAVGTLMVMQADQPLRDSAQRDQQYYNSAVIEGGRMWGEGYSAPVIAGAYALYGLASKKTQTAKVCYELIQASLYAGVLEQCLKAAIGRERPYMNEGSSNYKPFTLDDDYQSLPSGHTTNAFAVSTVLSKNIDSKFWKAAVYVPAVLTAASRVYQDKHWASDCFLGAAIGYYCGAWVVDQHDKNKSPVKITSIYPFVVNYEF